MMSLAGPDAAAPSVSRRTFLRRGVAGVAVTAAGISSGVASGAVRSEASDNRRRLNLVNTHTWESLDVVYFTRGMYIDESLTAISHLMRDHRAGEECAMDRVLFDSLSRLHASLDTDEPLHLLSGYRTPETNAKLRQRSKGVAKFSLHMEGRAADIYVPGIPTRTLQQTALSLQAGGVGYYGRSGFVHIDTGRVRNWERG